MADGMGRKSKINLALQGGGAHGAFTWGVLDRLIEDDSLEFSWLSGTSAGAVNAVALVSGMAIEGPAGARAALARVWAAVETKGVPDFLSFLPAMAGRDLATVLSPYAINPLGFNPLRDLLTANIDFAAVRDFKKMELLIAATEAMTGRARLFRRKEMTVERLLASACLPTLHHAVLIDGVAYWDGGFSANPDLITLSTESPVQDTLIVQLTPNHLTSTPRSATDIVAQVNDLTFNQPLIRDATLIVAAKEARLGLFAPAGTDFARLRKHRYHLISASDHTSGLAADSKIKPDKRLLSYLFAAGRTEAEAWLKQSRPEVGKRSTVDLKRELLQAAGVEQASRPAGP